MRIAIINPISETQTLRWASPAVESNRQSIGVQLGRALQDLGHQVDVYMADEYRPRVADEGVACVYYRTRFKRVIPATIAPVPWGLSRMIREGRYDLVVASELFQPSTIAVSRAARAIGVLAIWQELGDYQGFLFEIPARVHYALFAPGVLKRASMLLPRTERAKEFLLTLGARESQFGPEVPNGADETIFYFDSTAPRGVQIVCPGSLVDQKNPMLVLEAFVRTVLPAMPAARLVFKGRGPLEPVLRERARQAGVAQQVTVDCVRSNQADMAQLYRACPVGVVASRGKGSSLSPAEMAMCGTRVVVSETLYHAGIFVDIGAGVATPLSAEAIGRSLLRELQRADNVQERGAFAARAASCFGIAGAAERLASAARERLDAGDEVSA